MNRVPAAATRQALPAGSYPGNQAALRYLSRIAPRVQCRLEVGAVDDPLEAEADRAANQVLPHGRSGEVVEDGAVPDSQLGSAPRCLRAGRCVATGERAMSRAERACGAPPSCITGCSTNRDSRSMRRAREFFELRFWPRFQLGASPRRSSRRRTPRNRFGGPGVQRPGVIWSFQAADMSRGQTQAVICLAHRNWRMSSNSRCGSGLRRRRWALRLARWLRAIRRDRPPDKALQPRKTPRLDPPSQAER